MLEEKEVLTDEEIVEESVSEALAEAEMDKGPVDDEKDVKSALVSFILSVVGFVVCGGWIIGGIAAIVLGAISLGKLKAIKGTVEKQPHKVFSKIAKPVAIVDIILGAISAVAWFIYLIVVIVAAVVAATQGVALL